VKHLDLFSGIGGFALAAERVGWQTIGFCEVDPFCVRVIERRFGSDRWFSLPGFVDRGKAAGIEWLEELVGIAPDWLVVENVYHTWRRWMPELRSRLYERGYSSLPLRVSASDVGAVHHRARGWLVANPNSEQLRELSRWWSGPGREVAAELAQSWYSTPRRLGKDDGLPDPLDRRRALGNAIVPHAAELIFRGIAAVCK
jgi:DNA (cytosine-5)-methyltransferase 1